MRLELFLCAGLNALIAAPHRAVELSYKVSTHNINKQYIHYCT